ncbi:MAG: site-2 protease family protein [Planctomycetota bacterium]|jgi:Zn-dependent protease
MPRGFLIGRLFKTNIYCTLGFFLLMAICFLRLGASDAALICAALILSILVHEFGHVFAVRWLLKSESRVVLWALGGLCLHAPARHPRQQVAISLMGPAFGLALAGGCLLVVLLIPIHFVPLARLLRVMVYINVFWTAVNLLPIMPLDGGQALRSALGAKLGSGPARRIARWTSLLTAAAGTVAALVLGDRVLALLGVLLLFQNLAGPDVAYD